MNRTKKKYLLTLIGVACLLAFTACSTQKNTGKSRWWHAFNARYNTYYNGKVAFIEGAEEQEKGHKDNFTEIIPLYVAGDKNTKIMGAAKYARTIEKMEKAIKRHSIKKRPEWNKSRRKTDKDIEWLNRREYNPFLWKAWLLMGKSQFNMGKFDEAAATFSYMSRLYATQPAILGIARAWQAKSYVELGWLYDAEDLITKQRRDTMHYRARTDWDYTLADYYIESKQYEQAVTYLQKVIKHEKRKTQKAREWFLMGQLQTLLGNKKEADRAYRKVIHMNPPYELEFNAHIAQTEVMAQGNAKKMIRKLKRMAASDNNKDYLDQVYYAMGNIYLLQKDTVNAIVAYEKGCSKATRTGIEKGVLLLHLGNLYWQKEKYSDAKRCYGEAIGLLDKERPDYKELSERSKILDELVPYTDAIHLQDSLLELSTMNEADRLKAIDRVIDDLKKKEKEAKRAEQEAEVARKQQAQGAMGNRMNQRTTGSAAQAIGEKGVWYFYNPMAVNQGKQMFQQQWGKRENVDDWQRVNRTVVNLTPETAEATEEGEHTEGETTEEGTDSIAATTDKKEQAEADSAANDPHKREYYLAQIPFSEEQKQACHQIIQDGLFNSGIIFKDKLNNLPLSEKSLLRLTDNYPDFEKNDVAWYHLYLLYARMGKMNIADRCLARMQEKYPESDWTKLLSDPLFMENQRFGEHIEDSMYAATYKAFNEGRYDEVKGNSTVSEQRFPLGAHRDKFLLVQGLTLLNEGNAEECINKLKTVVEKYPQSEVSELAGMIIKGVQQGRRLYGGRFDLGDVWSRRSAESATTDSIGADTLSVERNTSFIFMLAYQPDSVNAHQMLFELAKYNFTNFLVRNFDLNIDQDNGINRMMVTGFLSYDEALQYARQLYSTEEMRDKLKGCRRIIISQDNLKMLGTRYSYNEYETFFEQNFAPLKVSEEQLLNIPETIVQPEEPNEKGEKAPQENGEDTYDDIMPASTTEEPGGFDFDEDFYR